MRLFIALKAFMKWDQARLEISLQNQYMNVQHNDILFGIFLLNRSVLCEKISH